MIEKAPFYFTSPIEANTNTMSRGSRIAVRKRMIARLPAIPRPAAMVSVVPSGSPLPSVTGALGA